MSRSFAAGSPQAIEKVATIADSLGAPAAEPYSFALCRATVREIVRVSDEAIRDAIEDGGSRGALFCKTPAFASKV